jgi:hypothetical protein
MRGLGSVQLRACAQAGCSHKGMQGHVAARSVQLHMQLEEHMVDGTRPFLHVGRVRGVSAFMRGGSRGGGAGHIVDGWRMREGHLD